MALTLSSPSVPSEQQRAAVRALASSIEAADGQPPLSDQALADLSSSSVRHVVAADGEDVVGYAQLAGDSLEVAAQDPALEPLLDALEGTPLRVWTHGAQSRVEPVLRSQGYRPVRGLLQLRRPLAEVSVRPAPAGVRIAAFRVGTDEDAWLRVNAAAFAAHPEQGRWTRADLTAREAESWFDPDGFLLAWRGDVLLGYHWTKQHSPTLGEVYVLGIDPSEQGTGLGGILLDHGLAQLYRSGCREVLLYVEDDNRVARRLYASSGFTEYDRDTQWRSPSK